MNKESSTHVSTPPATPNPEPETRDPQPAKRRRGAPTGNCNARVHGYYARKTIDACRRELEAATSYRGVDLDIVLALWQAVRLLAVVPDRDALQNDAMRRMFALVRRKYGLRSRKDDEATFSLFLGLVCDLILQPDLLLKLEKARKLA